LLLFKQFAVKSMLTFLRGLVLLRRFFVGSLLAPFRPVFRIFKSMICKSVISAYRISYWIRRRNTNSFGSFSFNLSSIFSNKIAMHASVFCIAVTVIAINVGSNSVRAEEFGERSVLFGLISDNSTLAVEEISSVEINSETRTSDYFDAGLVAGSLGTDSHSIDDNYVTTVVGGAVVAPVLVESKPSVAPRSEIETYVVVSGDTLGGVADRFGLSLNTLLWANGLSFRSTLRIGQSLAIPPVDGVVHKVRSGETLSSIARKYSADVNSIVSFNKLASANDLSIGEQLVVPGGKIRAVSSATSIAPVRSLFSGTPSYALLGVALPAGSGRWVWPSDLRYITQYYGWRHTGLDMDCNGHLYSTNSNYAAADGVIVYSGWRAGYGLTVEIDHGGGLKTRYAHHAQTYVSTGQSVTAGTPIGLCGNTGKSSGTHLHFEVIAGGRFANPLEYIR
jgi:murein DD-endopeptidase MepM/ murein hydrolase activator NlpD